MYIYESIEAFMAANHAAVSESCDIVLTPLVLVGAGGLCFRSGGNLHKISAAPGQDPWELRAAFDKLERKVGHPSTGKHTAEGPASTGQVQAS